MAEKEEVIEILKSESEPGVKWMIEERCRKAIQESLPGTEIEINVNLIQPEAGAVSPNPHGRPLQRDLLPGVECPIAVASGKGGVGKSTVAVNLAFTLSTMGKKTGLFDADIYGPNVPRMLGIEGQIPEVIKGKIVPIERVGMKIMSLGLIARPDQAVIWRGPLVSKAIEKMLADVLWGELDYLIIDLPPGTGDAQLTLSQQLSMAGAVMVTTPQDVSLSDVRRGIMMFQNVGVSILGLVENMAYYTCPTCGSEGEIFPGKGVEELIHEFGINLLGRIPIDPRISSGGDTGTPVTVTEPEGIAGMVFKDVARSVIDLTEKLKENQPALFRKSPG
jgi:ATP-binding protein involved in chromosome partitioning